MDPGSLSDKSLSAVKRELMKPTLRPSVSLVSETGLLPSPSLVVVHSDHS